MAADSKTFDFTLITPQREVLATEVTSVTLPAYDGQMGILAHRAPMMTELGSGELRVTTAQGEKLTYVISGGFAQMTLKTLTVLADSAMTPEESATETAAAS